MSLCCMSSTVVVINKGVFVSGPLCCTEKHKAANLTVFSDSSIIIHLMYLSYNLESLQYILEANAAKLSDSDYEYKVIKVINYVTTSYKSYKSLQIKKPSSI